MCFCFCGGSLCQTTNALIVHVTVIRKMGNYIAALLVTMPMTSLKERVSADTRVVTETLQKNLPRTENLRSLSPSDPNGLWNAD
jgi:hypothetical protein